MGDKSVKQNGGDCSGSTYKIYDKAGFPYDYSNSANFQSYAISSGLFREIGIGEANQDGDILSWTNHMAIFSKFFDDKINANTSRIKKGGHAWIQSNDMWTATKPNGPVYQPNNIHYFKGGVQPKVFRYQKLI